MRFGTRGKIWSVFPFSTHQCWFSVSFRPNCRPWVVSLLTSVRQGWSCAGVLINENTVLTAAHCLTQTTASEMKAIIGVHTILGKMNPLNYHTVAAIHRHPKFEKCCKNDLAILKLAKPVMFGPRINAACFPFQPYAIIDQGRELINRTAVIIGWGDSSQNAVTNMFKSFILQQGRCNSSLSTISTVPLHSWCTHLWWSLLPSCLWQRVRSSNRNLCRWLRSTYRYDGKRCVSPIHSRPTLILRFLPEWWLRWSSLASSAGRSMGIVGHHVVWSGSVAKLCTGCLCENFRSCQMVGEFSHLTHLVLDFCFD